MSRLARIPRFGAHDVDLETADGLRVEGVSVRYGGRLAVDAVTLHAPPGQLTGLVGPNGAGKTTTFNVCSGLLRPSAGGVRLDGVDVSRLGPAARAQRGLGRSFQRMELFDSLTVRENVALGREASIAGRRLVSLVIGTMSERAVVRQAGDEAIELCGLASLAEQPASALSTGQRRLVELARAVAGGFHILLLDEPSSGLDRRETERFGEILRDLVEQRRAGILLVEHDMDLVSAVCDYVYVLDFGELLTEGPTSQVLASDEVRAAYLGTEAVS